MISKLYFRSKLPGDGLEVEGHSLDRPHDSTEQQDRVEAADGGLHGSRLGRADD